MRQFNTGRKQSLGVIVAQRLTEPHFLLYQDEMPVGVCRIISVGITGILVDIGDVELSAGRALKIEYVDPRGDRCCRCRFPVAVGRESHDYIALDFGRGAPDWVRLKWREVVSCFLADL